MPASRKQDSDLAIPLSVQRKAGIKNTDRLEFHVSKRSITITAIPAHTYKPTKAEVAAIARGEAEIARGEFVTLSEFFNAMDSRSRKLRAKTAPKGTG